MYLVRRVLRVVFVSW